MKRKTGTFQKKLLVCFIVFTAVIFTVLWLLQTVFLQRFYDGMIIKNTLSAAEKISSHSKENDISDYIDKLSRENSVIIFVTDTDGSILYSSDEYKRIQHMHENGEIMPDMKPDSRIPRAHYRELPANYSEFLSKLSSSDTDTAELRYDDLYVCGRFIDYPETDGKVVLYIGTMLTPVGSTARIIRIQLIWVTILSVIIGAVIAWFMSRSFSRPISQLTEKAHKLGESSSDVTYHEGFCSELDELSHTLDATSEKLRKSREFQNELLANVSHDLRTPLTMIKGYAEMIRDISREDEQQCTEDVAVIVEEADRLTALVNEILEYSELQMTDAEPVMSEVNLSETVKTAAGTFRNLYEKDGFIFDCKIEEEVYVHGNASRLGRAVYNLTDNAVRHAGDEKWIGIALRTEKDRVIIEVSDHGNGIAKDELERIWDRYYTSRQRNGKGVSGLGLAIVKQTALLHNGRCEAESEEGKGSTFRIILNI